ncbi:hypothetical protein ABPG72_020803 [Tetrahymena utriculariae]
MIYYANEQNREERLQWATEYQDWTVQDFKKVLFSDESLMCCEKQGIKWIRKIKSQPFTAQMINPIKKYKGGIQQMVWGLIEYQGGVSLEKITGTINSEKYVDILSGNLESIKKRNKLFQQDNARCHTSNISKQWMTSNKIRILEWPAASPDLSPIENVWGYLSLRLKIQLNSYCKI